MPARCRADAAFAVQAGTFSAAPGPNPMGVAIFACMATTNRNQGGLLSAIFRRGREERLPKAAGGLTFTLVMSMVPLLAVSFALFARIPALRAAGEAIREHLLRGLLPAGIARTVLKHLAQFAGNAGGLTQVGFALLLVSALALAHERGKHAQPHLAGEESAPGAAPAGAVPGHAAYRPGHHRRQLVGCLLSARGVPPGWRGRGPPGCRTP
jgi:hypothetical protein